MAKYIAGFTTKKIKRSPVVEIWLKEVSYKISTRLYHVKHKQTK
jgi:cobalamin biosynthesis protein CobT